MQICDEALRPSTEESMASMGKAMGIPVLWLICCFTSVLVGVSILMLTLGGGSAFLWSTLVLSAVLLFFIWMMVLVRAKR